MKTGKALNMLKVLRPSDHHFLRHPDLRKNGRGPGTIESFHERNGSARTSVNGRVRLDRRAHVETFSSRTPVRRETWCSTRSTLAHDERPRKCMKTGKVLNMFKVRSQTDNHSLRRPAIQEQTPESRNRMGCFHERNGSSREDEPACSIQPPFSRRGVFQTNTDRAKNMVLNTFNALRIRSS
jgi:hypothetical protein